MGEGARVEAIDALRLFRIAMIKFIEACSAALNDAESEMSQTMNWLEHEQYNYWQGQIRKRQDLLGRAKEALRMKKVFKDSSGRIPSAVDEEKALRIAQARLEEAEQKFASTRKYARVLQKEIETYKGNAQRFATTLNSDLPKATAMLDQMMASLEAYVAYSPSEAATSAPAPDQTGPQEQTTDKPGGTDGSV